MQAADREKLQREVSVLQVVDAELRTSRGPIYEQRGKIFFRADRRTVGNQKRIELDKKSKQLVAAAKSSA